MALLLVGCVDRSTTGQTELTSTPKAELAFDEVAENVGLTARYSIASETRAAFNAKARAPFDALGDSPAGMAFGDIDADSDVDLLVLRGDERPHVYLSFVSESLVAFAEGGAKLGLDAIDAFAVSPVLVDLVGDSKPDLLVAGIGDRPIALYENNWPDEFEDVTDAVGLKVNGPTFGLAVADVDGDGDVDVLVPNLGASTAGSEPSGVLWLNEGKSKFVDASVLLAAAATELRHALVPSLNDLDGDGDVDMLLAGDNGHTSVLLNRLFASDFPADVPGPSTSAEADAGADAAADAAATDAASADAASADAATELPPIGELGFVLYQPTDLARISGRGVAIGDFDHDEDLDWFVSGGASLVNSKPASKLLLNRLAKGIVDRGETVGVDGRGHGLGSCMQDFDNDGLLDIFQVADASYLPADDDTDSLPERESKAAFYWADIDEPGTFVEASNKVGLGEIVRGRAAVCFDFDRDGDVDIFVTAAGQPIKLYRNLLNPTDYAGANYLGVRVSFEEDNPTGLGTRLYLKTGNVTQVREVGLDNATFGHGPALVHFGLAAVEEIDELRIVWPNGDEETEKTFLPNDVVLIRH